MRLSDRQMSLTEDGLVFSAFWSVMGKLWRGAKPEGKAVIDKLSRSFKPVTREGWMQ